MQIGGDYYQVQTDANGFKRIYDELEGVRRLFFRRDRGRMVFPCDRKKSETVQQRLECFILAAWKDCHHCTPG